MRKVQIAGTLFWGDDFEWILLDPHPLIEREHWMKDLDERFLVYSHDKGSFVVMVSRPFAISYRNQGEEVEIEEVEEPDIDVYKSKTYWLDKELRNEPQSLAE